MINITNTNVEQNKQVKVGYNGTSDNGTYISGHYFITEDEYENMTVTKLKEMAYEKIVEEFGEGK